MAPAILPETEKNTMTNLDILKGMRQLLDKPESWRKGWYWADKEGAPCLMEHACSFCIAGAIMKACNRPFCIPEVTELIYNKVGNIAAWNDAKGRTHADVIRLLDEMIAEQNA